MMGATKTEENGGNKNAYEVMKNSDKLSTLHHSQWHLSFTANNFVTSAQLSACRPGTCSAQKKSRKTFIQTETAVRLMPCCISEMHWLANISDTPAEWEKTYLKAHCTPFHSVSENVIQPGNSSKPAHTVFKLNAFIVTWRLHIKNTVSQWVWFLIDILG